MFQGVAATQLGRSLIQDLSLGLTQGQGCSPTWASFPDQGPFVTQGRSAIQSKVRAVYGACPQGPAWAAQHVPITHLPQSETTYLAATVVMIQFQVSIESLLASPMRCAKHSAVSCCCVIRCAQHAAVSCCCMSCEQLSIAHPITPLSCLVQP